MPILSSNGSNGTGGPTPLSFARWATGTLRRWRLVLAVTLLTLAAAVVSALVLPPVYRSEASFVSNTTGGGLKLPAGLSSLGGGLAGMASELGMNMGSDPSESPAFYAQLVHSRELLTRLVESRFADPRTPAPGDSARLVDILKLRKKEPGRRLELAIERMSDDISVEPDPKTNLVELTVHAPWPELAAAIANRTTALVSSFNLEQRTTRARAKREFVGERLAEAQTELAVAENRHRAFLEQNRMYRTSPSLTAEEARLSRQVDIASDMYTTLRREYETARINEVNDAPVITLVDTAVAPSRPRWPRPAPLVVIGLTAGVLLGLLAAGTATVYADWARRHPEEAEDVRRVTSGVVSRLRGSRGRVPPAAVPADFSRPS